MKIIKNIELVIVLVLLIGFFSCQNVNDTASSQVTVTISGIVTRLNSYPLDSAVVTLQNPLKKDTVDSQGSFSFSFPYSDASEVNTTMTVSRSGFYDSVLSVTYGPNKKSVSYGQIKLKGLSNSVDSVVITHLVPRNPAQIVFVNSSSSNIYVAGVGANETSTLIFEVRDSIGDALDQASTVPVLFSSAFYPNSTINGGTAPVLLPTLDTSDANGKVSVTIASGTQAGVIQLSAKVTLTTGKIISSQPVKVSVYSGFADPNHFTIAATNYNFPGLQRAFGPTLLVTVGIGDKYSNPVVPGTQVYFHTSHGKITAGNPTGEGGFTTATLDPENPYPAPPDTLPDLPRGYSKIYAQTLGENGTQIIDSIVVLWTGSPVIQNTGKSSFTVPNGGSDGPFTFQVSDIYGHPLSAGTTITVTAGTGTVTGDVSTTLFDTFSTGPGITTFTVFLQDDNSSDINPPVSTQLKVTVVHPVYGSYTLTIASGTVD